MKSISILLILQASTCSRVINCNEIKTGEFKTVNEDKTETKIIRTENTQIEYHNDGERETHFEVIWLSDCVYQLVNRKVVKGADPYSYLNNVTLQIEISAIKPDFYKVKATFLMQKWSTTMNIQRIHEQQ